MNTVKEGVDFILSEKKLTREDVVQMKVHQLQDILIKEAGWNPINAIHMSLTIWTVIVFGQEIS